MSGSSSIVIGFNIASDAGCECFEFSSFLFFDPWHNSGLAASTLSLIVIGVLVLICGGLYEVRTKRDALFPLTVFKDFTISE